jgi:hypothetical protein
MSARPSLRGSAVCAPGSGAVQARARYETGAAPSIIASFSEYKGLLAALRKCREERQISFETLDGIANAPSGYFSKVMAPRSQRSITTRAMLSAMFGLGVKFLVVDDPDTLQQINGLMKKRDEKVVRNGAVTFTVSRRFYSEIGRKGAQARNAQRIARRERARRAARARWDGQTNGAGQ